MSLLPSYYMVQLGFAPLPPFIANALAEIEVETSIEGASMFRLHFDLSRTMIGDLDAIAIDLFRPLVPVRVSLSFGLGLPLTMINGFVRDVRLTVGNGPGTARLEVTGADAMATLMGQVQAPAQWPNLPDSAIVSMIFARYGIAGLVTPTPPTRTMMDTTTVQQVRDNAYLAQIASFHGYKVFVRPDPVTGQNIAVFAPIAAMAALPPQGVLSIDFGSQTNLHSFNLTNDQLKPKTVVSLVTEPNTRVPVPVIALAAAEPPMGLEPSLMRIAVPPIEFQSGSDAANVAEKYTRALAEVSDSARTVSASGDVDGLKFARPLQSGLPVLIRGAGRQHSGLYLVTSVSHRISRDAYTQSFQAMRNAVGMFGFELFLDPLAPAA